MPSKLTIHKILNGESWVNVYHLEGAYSAAQSTTEADAIVAFERALTLTGVLFTHYNLSDNVEDTDAYITKPLNLMGLSGAAGDRSPLYTTLRIDFSKLGGGRPGRKYYRGVLTESLLGAYGAVDPTMVGVWQTEAQTLIDAVSAGGENFSYVTAAVYPFAQMRQLRRGSKKSPSHHRLSQCRCFSRDTRGSTSGWSAEVSYVLETIPKQEPRLCSK